MHLPDAHALEAYPYRLGENGVDLSSVGPIGDKRATKDHQQYRYDPYTMKDQNANLLCIHTLLLLCANQYSRRGVKSSLRAITFTAGGSI